MDRAKGDDIAPSQLASLRLSFSPLRPSGVPFLLWPASTPLFAKKRHPNTRTRFQRVIFRFAMHLLLLSTSSYHASSYWCSPCCYRRLQLELPVDSWDSARDRRRREKSSCPGRQRRRDATHKETIWAEACPMALQPAHCLLPTTAPATFRFKRSLRRSREPP